MEIWKTKKMIQKICPDCNTMFEYEPVQGYPDKRIYCDKDKARRKTEWDAKQGKPTQAPAIQQNSIAENLMAKHAEIEAENGKYQSTVYNRTVAANSYEVGKVGNRFKLYFEDAKELQAKMTELKKSGLMDKNIENLA